MNTDKKSVKETNFKTPNVKQVTHEGTKIVALDQPAEIDQSPEAIAYLYASGENKSDKNRDPEVE
jgi:hypothetical protein